MSPLPTNRAAPGDVGHLRAGNRQDAVTRGGAVEPGGSQKDTEGGRVRGGDPERRRRIPETVKLHGVGLRE